MSENEREECARDVICGMPVERATALKIVREYYFCSEKCRGQFLRRERAGQERGSL